MGFFDRLRKKQEITETAEKDAHFSSRQESTEETSDTGKKKGETPKKKSSKTQATTPVRTVTVHSDVLLHPIVTEKSTLEGTYVFAVGTGANKTEIAKAIEKSYGVKPSSVRVMNVAGKAVRWNGRTGKRQDWKKAIISLPAGKTINVYDA